MRRRINVNNSKVNNNTNDFTEDPKSDLHTISPIVALIIISINLFLYGIVFIIDNKLPEALYIKDEISHQNSFIAERAQADLKLLTDIGPRISGSYENEVLAVGILKKLIEEVQSNANKQQKIEMDTQVATGSYYLAFKPNGGINAYANVQNVIVKIHGKNNANSSILINAHFDSVPTSPGGSDDGIMCAVMLEIIRKLANSSELYTHNFIFLFNGAEETPLQASHGFITQHKWSKDIRVIVNLEAGGAGGKEILFQTGPDHSWLINYYKNIPHPHGQVVAEEIFQSGLVPSDTDFRVFRDFGHLFGYDIAFARNGYRYHTKYDGFLNIPLESYQHAGSNILSLLKNIGNARELLSHDDSQEKIVYYDFIGLFMVAYPENVSFIINGVVVVLSILIAMKSFWDIGLRKIRCSRSNLDYIFFVSLAIITGWLLSGGMVALIATILDSTDYTMSWYKNSWIVIGLYCMPIVFCLSTPIALLNHFNKDKFCKSIQCQVQMHCTRIIWTFVLLGGTVLRVRSSYTILIPVLFNTFGFSVIILFRLQHSIRKWLLVYLLFTIIPTMFTLYSFLLMTSLFMPISGRIGSNKNPEYIIGVICLLYTVLSTSFFVPIVTLARKQKYYLGVLFALFAVFFIIVFTPLGFPYSGDWASPAPQRFWIHHTIRKFHDETGKVIHKDSGYFLLNMDRNSPNSVRPFVKELANIADMDSMCDKYLLCGLPLLSSRQISMSKHSTWIPANPPIINEFPVKIKLISKNKISASKIRFEFSVAGPDHMSIFFSPEVDIEVEKINLIEDLPNADTTWNGTPVYFIKYVWGKQQEYLNFSIDLVSKGKVNSPKINMVVCGHYVDERRNTNTREYINFLKQFPDWADLMTGLASYEHWVF